MGFDGWGIGDVKLEGGGVGVIEKERRGRRGLGEQGLEMKGLWTYGL